MPEKLSFYKYWSDRITRNVSERQAKISETNQDELFTEISLLRTSNGTGVDFWFHISWHAREIETGVSEKREIIVRARDLLAGLKQLQGMLSRVRSNVVQHGEMFISDDYGNMTTRNHLREVPDLMTPWVLANFPVTRYDFEQHLELFERARKEFEKMSLKVRQEAISI